MQIIKRKNTEILHDTCGEIQEMFSSENISISYANIISKSTPHLHRKTDEIYYVLRGKGRMTIEDEKVNVEKDDLVLIPKNKLHTIERTSDDPLELLVITHPRFDTNDVIDQIR